jgi:DNA polymerase elongation subunit (family B)
VTQQEIDARAIERELFGGDGTTGIVAVERAGERHVRVYIRDGDRVVEERAAFAPWIVVDRASTSLLTGHRSLETLQGHEALAARARFETWSTWLENYRALRDAGVGIIAHPSPAEQYLIDSGRGLFRGMEFGDLVRAQLDIETLGFDATLDEARIILITLSTNGRDQVVLRGDELDEPTMIDHLAQWVSEVDPDVIEGHNLFNFDLPYLAERARRYRRALLWGRDGSAVRFGNEQRFKVGPRTIPYGSAHVYGRHFIDTYQQIQRYDSGGQLESYALKPAIEALGLTQEGRTFVAGEDIASLWNLDRERLVRYALDDVYDVNTLSELALPTEFYQSQILPRTLQSVAVGGPGEKVNDLLVRVYLSRGESVPLPSPPRGYPGGFAEVRRSGRFGPVVKCDVESLYPAIMLSDRIAPASDHLGIFLPMLSVLTERRLLAKRAEQQSSGAERARWRGIQSSFKVLINSFYGYLGYGRGYLNDFDAAEAVTIRGQRIVQHVVDRLEALGATAIEVDTDGVYFQPALSTPTLQDELSIIARVNATLPQGIRLAHDGRYRGMLSLKLKNYALLDYEGRVTLKGSSLRSRREEPFLRRFVRDAVPHFLDPEAHGALRDFYLDIAERVLDGDLPIADICRTETITDQTFRSDSNRRLAEALGEERIGERVLVYQRSDGKLARMESYNSDEDRQYLLRRLREMAERFRPLFDSDVEFDHTFPLLTIRTDVDALREAQLARQLDLFAG